MNLKQYNKFLGLLLLLIYLKIIFGPFMQLYYSLVLALFYYLFYSLSMLTSLLRVKDLFQV